VLAEERQLSGLIPPRSHILARIRDETLSSAGCCVRNWYRGTIRNFPGPSPWSKVISFAWCQIADASHNDVNVRAGKGPSRRCNSSARVDTSIATISPAWSVPDPRTSIALISVLYVLKVRVPHALGPGPSGVAVAVEGPRPERSQWHLSRNEHTMRLTALM